MSETYALVATLKHNNYSVAQAIVLAHKGKITAENKNGKGLTITVTLSKNKPRQESDLTSVGAVLCIKKD